eukprot:1063699-Rhodomonas_salina.3
MPRTGHAASGTDARIRYPMSGTDVAHASYAYAMRCPVLTKAVLALFYAYAMRCPVLAWAVLALCYAMSGTDVGVSGHEGCSHAGSDS